MFILSLLCVVLSYVAWSVLSLARNYRRALPIGVPIILVPVYNSNIAWQIFEPHFFKALHALRIPLPRWLILLQRGWEFKVKARFHEELGTTVLVVVSPGSIYLSVCDAEANESILRRRKDFVRPPELYQILGAFGPCLSTASPEDWPRHRKELAAPFMNESIMKNVWDVSVTQARQMKEAWSNNQASIRFGQDTRTLTLNVLAAIGFRKISRFESFPEAKEDIDGRFSYRDALQMVLENAILVMVVGRKHLLYSWLPAWVQRVGKAANDFQSHMERMVDEEMAALNRGEKGTGSLMTSFIRAVDQHQQDRSKGMSIDEVFGNTFIVNFAGHDTTANVFGFSLLHLAANPDVQEWVGEEVRAATADLREDDWDYATLFPKLVRCQALIFETLRHYPPVLAIPKRTNDQAQQLPTANGIITIPPGTTVLPNAMGTHTSSQYWPDPLTWKPSRWISAPISESKESVITPRRVTFLPWSDGPQNCPGQKYSLVEYVAVIATLFNNHRIRAVRENDESFEEMQRRVRSVANDAEYSVILKARDADKVKITLEQL